ncbi:MAG: hypothetical protein JW982_13415 [Spirochaetes bacterium]|nr:hypothetical protein [Spirochaetota bacterium]
MSSMILSLILVFCGLSIGYTIRKFSNADFSGIRKKIQIFCLLIIAPVTIVFSVWVAPWKHFEMFSLPFICVLTLALGAGIAFVLAGPLGLDRQQRAVYFVCGGFSNLGSLGGLVCFMLIGEAGYALVAFYLLFERIWYFSAGFSLAKSVSRYSTRKESFSAAAVSLITDPFIALTLASTIIGIIFNMTMERPELFGTINRIVIPVNSFILMISIGLAMRFGPMRNYLKHALVMGMIKGLIMPAFAFSLGMFFGLDRISGGLPLKTVLILSFMPVGFAALVPPTMYDLDIDLANTCWFITTSGLVISVPLLSFLTSLL